MELVPLSDRQLTALAKRDPVLRRVFWGVYPEDQLPPLRQTAGRQTHRAMIVNTDPKGEPGRHWLGLWTSGDTCEILDSYGLPMDTYGVPHVLEWIWRYFSRHPPQRAKLTKFEQPRLRALRFIVSTSTVSRQEHA